MCVQCKVVSKTIWQAELLANKSAILLHLEMPRKVTWLKPTSLYHIQNTDRLRKSTESCIIITVGHARSCAQASKSMSRILPQRKKVQQHRRVWQEFVAINTYRVYWMAGSQPRNPWSLSHLSSACEAASFWLLVRTPLVRHGEAYSCTTVDASLGSPWNMDLGIALAFSAL